MNYLASKQQPTVIQIAQTNLLQCTPETPVMEAARLMRHRNTSSILIYDRQQVVGIWTEADCTKLDFSRSDYCQLPIASVMSSPVKTIAADAPLSELTRMLHNQRLRHLLVVDGQDQAVGIVSQSDVIQNQGVERFLYLRPVNDSFDRQVPILDGTLPLTEIISTMGQRQSTSVLLQLPDEQILGIITERDLLTILASGQTTGAAWDYASKPVLYVTREDSLLTAYQQLKSHNIRHLAVKDEHRQLLGVLSMQNIMSDIELAYISELESVLEQRDTALRESQKSLMLAERIINASLDGIMITDHRGNIISVNAAFTRVTGYAEDEVLGQSPSILSSGRHDGAFYQQMWQSLAENGSWQGEIWNRRKNGEIYPEWLTIVEISEPGQEQQQHAAIFSDITERKITEQRITALAYFDELTHLPNRRLFNDRLQVALATARRDNHKLAVLFIDLDRFKQINDSLGHSIGDMLLVAVASRLQKNLKEGDTVARLGGDEFTVLLTEIREADMVVNIANRLLKALRDPYLIEGHELVVTPSIGIAVSPMDGNDSELLMKHADIAMYRAKELGRDAIQMYTPAMNTHIHERLEMQNNLRKALGNNEFELYYQPQIDSHSGQVIGVEALLRWNSVAGQIPPGKFIPIIEELGMFLELDAWVLRQACRQRQQWLRQGVDCGRVAVNISALQFSKGDLYTLVKEVLAETGLAAHYLELEITEGCFIEHLSKASEALRHLKALGVHIALDDFGTGYSALSYLTQLPIDVLKIDGSFIAKVPHEPRDSQIVSTVIAMGKSLELELLAEGVEQTEQLEFLLAKGCRQIQGYLISQPMPAEQLVNFLKLHHQ